MAPLCCEIDCEQSKMRRGVGREHQLLRKRAEYNRVVSAREMEAFATASWPLAQRGPVTRQRAKPHRAVRVATRTWLSHGRVQACTDVPTLSLGKTKRNGRKPSISPLILYPQDLLNNDNLGSPFDSDDTHSFEACFIELAGYRGSRVLNVLTLETGPHGIDSDDELKLHAKALDIEPRCLVEDSVQLHAGIEKLKPFTYSEGGPLEMLRATLRQSYSDAQSLADDSAASHAGTELRMPSASMESLRMPVRQSLAEDAAAPHAGIEQPLAGTSEDDWLKMLRATILRSDSAAQCFAKDSAASHAEMQRREASASLEDGSLGLLLVPFVSEGETVLHEGVVAKRKASLQEPTPLKTEAVVASEQADEEDCDQRCVWKFRKPLERGRFHDDIKRRKLDAIRTTTCVADVDECVAAEESTLMAAPSIQVAAVRLTTCAQTTQADKAQSQLEHVATEPQLPRTESLEALQVEQLEALQVEHELATATTIFSAQELDEEEWHLLDAPIVERLTEDEDGTWALLV